MAIVMLMHVFLAIKITKLSGINTVIFYVFDTVKVLVTFQSDSDGRLWLWTSDFDCYELNGACQLSLIDYY